MYNFFAGIGKINFSMFGPIHISLLVLLIVLIFLMYLFRDKLKKLKINKYLPKVFATILLLNMLIYYMGMLCTNTLDLKNNFPLHICFLANFALIYILYSNNKKLFSIAYYFAFLGPIPAIIWCNLHYAFDTYVFYQFIICHQGLLLIDLYMLFVLDYKVDKKDLKYAGIILIIYLIIIGFINYIFKTNYLLLNSLPVEVTDAWSFLKLIPAPICLFIAGSFAFLIAYSLVYLNNKKF